MHLRLKCETAFEPNTARLATVPKVNSCTSSEHNCNTMRLGRYGVDVREANALVRGTLTCQIPNFLLPWLLPIWQNMLTVATTEPLNTPETPIQRKKTLTALAR
eukprot:4561362-Amphidinium_carterae.1